MSFSLTYLLKTTFNNQDQSLRSTCLFPSYLSFKVKIRVGSTLNYVAYARSRIPTHFPLTDNCLDTILDVTEDLADPWLSLHIVHAAH